MSKGIVFIDAKKAGSDESVRFCLLVDPSLAASSPENDLKKFLESAIKEVSIDQPFSITSTAPVYDLKHKLDMPEFGNTVVEVHLPYCLHLPSGTEFDIKLPDSNARVLFEKVWTCKAKDSSLVDIFAEEKTTYFGKVTLQSPKLPQDPALGWNIGIEGKNVEKIRDMSGYFRFTKLRIFLFTNYTSAELEGKSLLGNIRKEVTEKVHTIINLVLDVYRYVTKEDFVERLGFVNVTDVYFFEHNRGFYPVNMNTQAAVMNRPSREIQDIKTMLEGAEQPLLYELIFLDARSSLHKRMLTLCVVSSFQALEIFLENFLIEKYAERGVMQGEIDKKLGQVWRTKDRLKELLKETTGHSLTENKALWDQWCTMCDQVRDEVIHRGKEPTLSEAEKALRLNENVVAWIKSLS